MGDPSREHRVRMHQNSLKAKREKFEEGCNEGYKIFSRNSPDGVVKMILGNEDFYGNDSYYNGIATGVSEKLREVSGYEESADKILEQISN